MKISLFMLASLLTLAACTPSFVEQSPLYEPVPLEPSPTSSGALIIPSAGRNQDDAFDLDTMNTRLPEDIIQEVGYFGGMGGCGRFCNCIIKDDDGPTVFMERDAIEVMGNLGAEVCGLTANEVVNLSVTRPDGVRLAFQTISDNVNTSQADDYSATFEYVPGLEDPLGDYLFQFQGNGWSIEKSVSLQDVKTPHLFIDPENHLLILYKFQPNENVRVLAYAVGESGNKLMGWKAFQTDENGKREIRNSLEAKFVAIGEESGQVWGNTKGYFEGDWFGIHPGTSIYCPGAPIPAGIRPGGYAVVTADALPYYEIVYDVNDSGVYGVQSLTRKGTLPKDTPLKIDSNPVCHHGQFYWTVRCLGAACGYVTVPEAGLDGYYLQPVDEFALPPTPEVVNLPACPGPLPTRLRVGMSAQVTTSGMAPQLALRAQPSLSAEKVHVIAAGRKMVILEGPVCADGSYWWRIRSEQGFEGWSREGDNQDYWIDPLP